MKTGKRDSKFDTDTMSPTARQRMARKQMAQKQMTGNRSEQRFLADQAADARTAMMQTVAEMKHSLVKADDLSRVNAAFFTVNGYVSVLFFVFWAADVWYARRGV